MLHALLAMLLVIQAPEQGRKVEVAPGGAWAATLPADGGVRLWSLERSEPPRQLPKDAARPARALAFTPDGATLVTAHDGGEFRSWDVRTGALIRSVQGPAGLPRIESMTLLPPGGVIAVVAGADRSLRRLDLPTGRELLRSDPAEVPVDGTLRASKDGLLLASRGPDRKLVLLDARSFARLKAPDVALPDEAALAFSPDGKLLCTTTQDGEVLIVELPEGRILARQTTSIRSVAFDEKGVQVLLLARDGRVRRYDARTMKEIAGETVAAAEGTTALLAENGMLITTLDNGQMVLQPAVAEPSGPEKFARVPLIFGTNREPRDVDGSVLWHALRFFITIQGFKYLGIVTLLLGIAGVVSWSSRNLWNQPTISARQAILLIVVGCGTTLLLWTVCTRILSFRNASETIFSLGILACLPASVHLLHRCGESKTMRLVALLGLEAFLLAAGAALNGVMHVRTEAAVPGLHFGGDNARKLIVGTCEVTVPIAAHRLGTVDRPEVAGIQFELPDPDRHMIVANARIEDPAAIIAALKQRVAAAPLREAFIFVHGYNVTFEDAALRTAQIAYDIDYKGVPLLYSWPSQGTVAGYPWDAEAVEDAVPHFHEFLKTVALNSGAKTIHLIAHSMGNRLLTRVLKELPLDPDAEQIRKPIQEVVLAAPDINANIFESQLAGPLVKNYPHVTLYANSNDRALTASRAFNNSRRAGDSADGQICVVPKLDSIDVSTIDTNMDGHGYFGSNHVVLLDLRIVLKEGRRAVDRFPLSPRRRNGLPYYLFTP